MRAVSLDQIAEFVGALRQGLERSRVAPRGCRPRCQGAGATFRPTRGIPGIARSLSGRVSPADRCAATAPSACCARSSRGCASEVLGAVRGRLRARGVRLDEGDLEACYAAAWQGLYAAVLAGEEIANPAGWLVLVTLPPRDRRAPRARARRSRSRRDADRGGDAAGMRERAPAAEPDLAAELDDRARLRQLFEGLRGAPQRARARSGGASATCRASRAPRPPQRMGISEARMRKLMEGRGPGSPGVAGKVGELLQTISGGGWCEQQGSLMRGLAFGILDPRGERYRLARLHQRECPACRAYVLSLRGLAAVLPPLPLPWGLALGPAHRRHPPRADALTGVARGLHRPAPGAGAGAGVRPGQPLRGQRRRRGGGSAGAGPGSRRRARRGRRRRRGLAAGRLGGREARGGLPAGAGGRLRGSLVAPHHAASRRTEPSHTAASAPPAGASSADAAAIGAGCGAARRRPSRGAHPRAGASAARVAPRGARGRRQRAAAARHAQREFGPEQAARRDRGSAGSPTAAPPPRGASRTLGRVSSAEPPRASTVDARVRAASGPPEPRGTGVRARIVGSGARKDFREPLQRRAGCRAGAYGRWRSRASGQAVADDVAQVLVARSAGAGRAWAPRPARRCCEPLFDGEVPRGDVGVGELPLEDRRAAQPVVGVDLAADRVEQQRQGLGVAHGGALAHADDARLGERAPALGELLERVRPGGISGGPGSVSAGSPAERSLVCIDWTPSGPIRRRCSRRRSGSARPSRAASAPGRCSG